MSELLRHIIYIDSSKTKENEVTLFKIEGGKKVTVAKKSDEISIIKAIKELLAESKLTIRDIDTFEANPGPGSFTGIKVGLTIANVLNWGLGRPKNSWLQKPEYGGEPNIQLKKGL